jgi:hypothetical protein
MLHLRKGRPPAIKVPLGGGAFAMVRPATATEIDLANADAGAMLLGLIDSRETAASAIEMLGKELGGVDITTPKWINVVGNRLSLLHIANLCIESWSGVCDDDGAIEKPNLADIALLLRDSSPAQRIDAAIKSSVNLEVAEKNELAASPDGEAVADGNIAQTAGA